MTGQARTAGDEWRANWTLPIAAMIGFSTIGLQSYGIGPFVTHLEQSLGWTRAEVMIGLSLSNFVGVFLNIIIGMIVDRFGARKIALTGLFVKTGAFALLGTTTASLLNWSVLWVILAVGVVLVQSTVWTSAVAARFDKARGAAFAITLTGGPITAALAPLLATWLIADYGWRVAFMGVGAAWLLVTFPVCFLFFRDGRDRGERETDHAEAEARPVEGLTFREGLKTRGFNRLMIGFGTFAFYNMAMAANLVPLLGEAGASPLEAARIAAIMGIVGIIARLSVGFLLDRFPGSVIGAVTQFLPVIGCGILLMHEPSTLLLGLAVGLFGLATGAEMDTALYLATRHFGLKAFAALFGAVITFGAVNAAISPIVSGWMHDTWGSYDPMLVTIMVLMAIGSLAMATIGRPPPQFARGH